MAIRIYSDKITIGSFTLKETGDGISFDGAALFKSIIKQGTFQGTVAGYTSGGIDGASPSNVIDKFPFANDTNASDVADLFAAVRLAVGQSSEIAGYSSGGYSDALGTSLSDINKFIFNTSQNALDIADLTTTAYGGAGQSSDSYGYRSGGEVLPAPVYLNVIDKFPFAADANAVDVGDLTKATVASSGQSSAEYGYVTGGYTPTAQSAVIEKFSFASGVQNATFVGYIVTGLAVPSSQSQDWWLAGQSSATSGYASGGLSAVPAYPTVLNSVHRFPFATDYIGVEISDLTVARLYVTGQSSENFGYTSGGSTTLPETASNIIDKFSFVADVYATDVGDLTVARYQTAGHQD